MNVPERNSLRPRSRQAVGVSTWLAQALIRAYQLTLSALVGRQCRYLPTCSDYASEAIGRFGLWPGLWMGLARLVRCSPLGGDGFDPVPEQLPESAGWYMPWRYGRWRSRQTRSGGEQGD